MEKRSPIPTLGPHGAAVLPSVSIDCYNVELRDADGFVGDRANKAAFRAIISRRARDRPHVRRIYSRTAPGRRMPFGVPRPGGPARPFSPRRRRGGAKIVVGVSAASRRFGAERRVRIARNPTSHRLRRVSGYARKKRPASSQSARAALTLLRQNRERHRLSQIRGSPHPAAYASLRSASAATLPFGEAWSERRRRAFTSRSQPPRHVLSCRCVHVALIPAPKGASNKFGHVQKSPEAAQKPPISPSS
jgi:hypothetical protein